VTDTLEAPHWQARDPSLRRLGPFSRDRKAYLIRSGDGALAERLDAWLLAREADGTLARLRAHHLGSESAATRTAEPLHALLAAIDERLALMPLVAEAKRRSGSPIAVPERETMVIEAALAAVQASAPADRQLDARAVRALFREQIEAAKEIQRARLADAAPRGDAGAEQPPDLERELRPALIRIGDRIALLLPALSPDLDPDVVAAVTRSELHERGLTPARLDSIAAALARVAGSAAAPRSDPAPGHQ
jgi:chorismate mutase-like protein